MKFSKFGPARYIGHLDLARALERALNRARIPMAYSQGFNRRPKMQLAAALPLGFTSECELADIWLVASLPPTEVQARLMAKMAPGIEITRVDEIALTEPALQTITAVSEYEIRFLNPAPVSLAEIQLRVDAFLAAEQVVRIRQRGKKGKAYDLRPLVLALSAVEGDQGIEMLLRVRQEPARAGRPDELLLALDLDPLAARIHRSRLLLAGE